MGKAARRAASPSASRRTRCGTASRRTCSSAGMDLRTVQVLARPRLAQEHDGVPAREHRARAVDPEPARHARARPAACTCVVCARAHASRARARRHRARARRGVRARAACCAPNQRAVLRAVERCRTAALGGHLDVCLACGRRGALVQLVPQSALSEVSVARASAMGGERMERAPADALLPRRLHAAGRAALRRERNRAKRCSTCSSRPRRRRCSSSRRDPKWLGAELGVTMVLHTWTRELPFHPHVHAIVTGGGLTDDDAAMGRARATSSSPCA